jgi:hypothetical protein
MPTPTSGSSPANPQGLWAAMLVEIKMPAALRGVAAQFAEFLPLYWCTNWCSSCPVPTLWSLIASVPVNGDFRVLGRGGALLQARMCHDADNLYYDATWPITFHHVARRAVFLADR